ncbi:unnamed protein product [Protopolystoma xenopodis]|uniref:Uncharacterized protein n=1 Tax=Protopolystoma xenopodis TaxID=117903 RepID=A0A448WBN0_9PLAT|nr:unnamed protein product [Protopolystoma xenopodis]
MSTTRLPDHLWWCHSLCSLLSSVRLLSSDPAHTLFSYPVNLSLYLHLCSTLSLFSTLLYHFLMLISTSRRQIGPFSRAGSGKPKSPEAKPRGMLWRLSRLKMATLSPPSWVLDLEAYSPRPTHSTPTSPAAGQAVLRLGFSIDTLLRPDSNPHPSLLGPEASARNRLAGCRYEATTTTTTTTTTTMTEAAVADEVDWTADTEEPVSATSRGDSSSSPALTLARYDDDDDDNDDEVSVSRPSQPSACLSPHGAANSLTTHRDEVDNKLVETVSEPKTALSAAAVVLMLNGLRESNSPPEAPLPEWLNREDSSVDPLLLLLLRQHYNQHQQQHQHRQQSQSKLAASSDGSNSTLPTWPTSLDGTESGRTGEPIVPFGQMGRVRVSTRPTVAEAKGTEAAEEVTTEASSNPMGSSEGCSASGRGKTSGLGFSSTGRLTLLGMAGRETIVGCHRERLFCCLLFRLRLSGLR